MITLRVPYRGSQCSSKDDRKGVVVVGGIDMLGVDGFLGGGGVVFGGVGSARGMEGWGCRLQRRAVHVAVQVGEAICTIAV
jgi:hypothetical protein